MEVVLTSQVLITMDVVLLGIGIGQGLAKAEDKVDFLSIFEKKSILWLNEFLQNFGKNSAVVQHGRQTYSLLICVKLR